MNASPSPHPAEWQETEDLLPPVERDLPAGRHQFHKERLMAQVHDDHRTTAPARPPKLRNRFLRPAIVLPVAACALAGAIAAGGLLTGRDADTGPGVATGPVLTTDIGTASASGTTTLLDRISLAAAKAPTPQVRDDQYLYIESTTADTYVKTVDDKHSVVSEKLHRRQVWESPDGKKGWLIEPGNSPDGGETLDSPYAGAGAYNDLVTLSTDPDALLKKVYEDSKGQGNSPDHAAFEMIGDLIGESYPPAGLEAALYKAAAKIPGVVTVDDAVDAVGRHGVAVARLDEVSGERTEWIFDKKTYTFLGQRRVQVQKGENSNPEDLLIKPGTITFTSAITTRAIVDQVKETPSRPS
ncbi:CU044_5270 family protein [Streptomyces sp. NPDC102462]|uniref:CU044_5270 family protein n=1 Tax=Streptomyces sp. NPDC102462 TaxID=3366178 RepID=UPI00381553C8